ncbi:MAG TPA: hypothetical protein VFH56_13910 [Acidimicrobiales bacterium]|nr:hypothetical protein [Acidimicrobiales bacterium]
MFGVRYEGLRELLQALRIVNAELYAAVVAGLGKAGDIVRVEAEARFTTWGGDRDGIQKAAEGFRALVRPNTQTMAIVSVGQTLRRSADLPRRRSNFGALQMKEGLLPARSEKMPEVVSAIDTEVSTLLHSHGF